ncbi:MAG: bacitracin ABC transporter ATP-binding protein [Candidatus Marinimicrobia bacterium]|nr:bacitracin ABC transporter ATP-binding protein [Candidatus Neomarinimicrobiota bacterium]|tara:strand:+ start:1722 stop:2606 length:885 start_codon:yes stop_codon:yes gene_type:complete
MESHFIRFKNIQKRYLEIEALKNISFSIPENSVFGILGANGSGKSTLMKILPGLITNWSGQIYYKNKILNKDKTILKKEFGYLIESPTFYEYLSARKNLEMLARISSINFNRINKVLEIVNLEDRSNDTVASFSYGMKQRLGIAQVLLHNPKVIVLDEPNNGLDPNGISDMNKLIRKLQHEGKTICLSTHNLRDVEDLCTHVSIFKSGVSSQTISMQSLISNSKKWSLSVLDSEIAKNAIDANKSIKLVDIHNNKLLVESDSNLNFEQIQDIFRDSGLSNIKKESNLIEYFNNV